ncbi:MAG: hypothetical protein LBH05_02215 [Deferribacteraceae bacterium]|jgi:hypothetical protein|nr:hypothetical protein [Deferribacteraceae bacterium]
MKNSTGYLETETPTEADTGKNILRYFKNAGKLQISQPNWKDKDGSEKRGKTVTLDIAALKGNPAALDIIKQIVR